MKSAGPLFALVVACLLSACGFHLRGSLNPVALSFGTIYIALPTTSELHAALRRGVEASTTKARVLDDPKGAQVVLAIEADNQTKNILSLNASGRVREYELVRTLAFRLYDQAGQNWLPPSQITVRRNLTFSDAEILAKEAEEATLQRDMQNDLAQQLLRRLSAARSPQ